MAEYRFKSRNMFFGEVLRKGITIARSSGTLSISSATVTVYDTSWNVITAEANATIDGGNVYALITAGTTARGLIAVFKAVDGTQTIKARLEFNVLKA